MANSGRPAPAPDDGGDDDELSGISQSIAFDEGAYRRLLSEQGVPDAQIEILVAPIKAQATTNARLLQRDQRRTLSDFRGTLLDEFKLPPTTPLTGTTKAEMRRSAQQFRTFADSIAAAAAPAPAAAAGAPAAEAGGRAARTEDPREAGWVAPPASATEVVTNAAGKPWADVQAHALDGSGKASTKREVFADLKAHGPRQIRRPTMTGIIARAEPKQT